MRVFDEPTLDRVDHRDIYGEVRVNSIGSLGSLVVVNVTHTDREQHTRLISARAATRAERAAYLEFGRELDTEPLYAELRERLEDPALELDLAHRSVDDLIEEISRDLGVAVQGRSWVWRRRTPEDIATLRHRAAAPLRLVKSGVGRISEAPSATKADPAPD